MAPTITSRTEPARIRKTPSQARSRATTEAVLAAAAHILEAHGLAAFNTNAVAERAGVSIGSLYQYYPNKDAILIALIEQQSGAFHQTMAALFEQAKGPAFIDDMRSLLETAVEWHAVRPLLHRILDAEEQRLQPHIDLERGAGAIHQAFIGLMRRRRDELGDTELERFAEDIGAIGRVMMEAEAGRAEPDWPAAIDRTLGAIMGYVSVHTRVSRQADAA